MLQQASQKMQDRATLLKIIQILSYQRQNPYTKNGLYTSMTTCQKRLTDIEELGKTDSLVDIELLITIFKNV